MKIAADSPAELLEQIAKLDVRVPRRTEGRTTEHTERYAAAHLLSAFACTDVLTYPLELAHRDRPDFCLSMPCGTVGLEHTEAVPENDAHRHALRERGYGPDVYFLTRATPGERRKPAKQLIQEIEQNQPAGPWVGDSVEHEWAQAMFHFVMRKITAVESPGFKKHCQEWLVIYDNWPAPVLDLEVAAEDLHVRCAAANVFQTLAKVFVMSGSEFCLLDSAGINLWPVNDLWKT